jgi:hypothetical protein
MEDHARQLGDGFPAHGVPDGLGMRLDDRPGSDNDRRRGGAWQADRCQAGLIWPKQA